MISESDTSNLQVSNDLLHWFNHNKREMPWRETKNPYNIWLSEVILQQTRVNQGIPYYLKFITQFPTVTDLAKAKESEVLKYWQGLGYYTRARNLHHTAQYIVENLNAQFPSNYNDLLKLKGIGEYTAAAISSICYNEKAAVIDGNVIRVISRLFSISEPFNTAKGKKVFKILALKLLHPYYPGNHNQAMMELGSLICKPQNPNCESCPLQTHCIAWQQKQTHLFPAKILKRAPIQRYISFLVPIINHTGTVLIQRLENDIWKNMFTFPFFESETELNHLDLFKKINAHESEFLFKSEKVKKIKHILTHQVISASFYPIYFDKQEDWAAFISSNSENEWEVYIK